MLPHSAERLCSISAVAECHDRHSLQYSVHLFFVATCTADVHSSVQGHGEPNITSLKALGLCNEGCVRAPTKSRPVLSALRQTAQCFTDIFPKLGSCGGSAVPCRFNRSGNRWCCTCGCSSESCWSSWRLRACSPGQLRLASGNGNCLPGDCSVPVARCRASRCRYVPAPFVQLNSCTTSTSTC